uniref:Uncharacterized protein n=1 Tax=Oryza sativa subsp. japonica TaxID=39947 RepID=Q6Z2B7_ORYSJ|nr:hypothetical protein [Oryza sativa Japonica Group]
MELRWISASGRWLPGFFSLLRCRQWIRRGLATTESTAKLRRRSKHGNGSAFTVTATSGGVRRKRTGGRGRALHCEAEGGGGADRKRPGRRRMAAGAAAGGGERGRARGERFRRRRKMGLEGIGIEL